MILDQISLLIAIGAAATALTITLFISWLGSRQDTYLLSWTAGLALASIGVIVYSLSGTPYVAPLQMLSLLLMMSGVTVIYAGVAQFRAGIAPMSLAFGLWAGAVVVIAVAFATGASGLGTAFANVGLALFFLLAGREHWIGRAEFPLPMSLTAILYGATAISFLLCGVVLLADRQMVLQALPTNWAEDLNSLVIIVSLAGTGALALTLSQMRKTQLHRRQAMMDPLTDLLNRRAVFDLADAGGLDRDVTVVMFDIDHFKSINDRFGHALGDAVLRHFADVLRANMREADRAARLGGEEFCLILDRVDARDACDIAERVRLAFVRSTLLPDPHHEMTVSAGVGVSREADDTFEALLRRADEALYAAKAAGRNQVQAPQPRLVA